MGHMGTRLVSSTCTTLAVLFSLCVGLFGFLKYVDKTSSFLGLSYTLRWVWKREQRLHFNINTCLLCPNYLNSHPIPKCTVMHVLISEVVYNFELQIHWGYLWFCNYNLGDLNTHGDISWQPIICRSCSFDLIWHRHELRLVIQGFFSVFGI